MRDQDGELASPLVVSCVVDPPEAGTMKMSPLSSKAIFEQSGENDGW